MEIPVQNTKATDNLIIPIHQNAYKQYIDKYLKLLKRF